MNEPNLNGPESLPIKDYIKTLPITVTVLKDDKVINEQRIDYSVAEHRKWIGRVTVWAVSNGYTVECRATEIKTG